MSTGRRDEGNAAPSDVAADRSGDAPRGCVAGGVAKALLPYDGDHLVERAVRAARLGGCDEVVVVLGFDAERVQLQADLDGSVVAVNPDWESGMGSSLRIGLAAVPARCQAAVVLLVDQPFVSAEAVRAVIDEHRQGADIVTAAYHGRRGHPVLFAARHWPEIAASAVGDQGARSFLAAHGAETAAVACDGLGSLDDVDTPADLADLAEPGDTGLRKR